MGSPASLLLPAEGQQPDSRRDTARVIVARLPHVYLAEG